MGCSEICEKSELFDKKSPLLGSMNICRALTQKLTAVSFCVSYSHMPVFFRQWAGKAKIGYFDSAGW